MSEAGPSTEGNLENPGPQSAGARTVAKLAGLTRYLVVAPIGGLFVAAVVLTVVAVVDVFKITVEAASGHGSLNHTVVGFIEVADIFLLAVVLYIMALGLYELFIDPNLPLPEWLVVRSLEDLKEKLVGVVVVVLAIFFLGRLIESDNPQEALFLGVGIAAVIASLAYFAKSVLLHKSE